jgi:hypothetical protein
VGTVRTVNLTLLTPLTLLAQHLAVAVENGRAYRKIEYTAEPWTKWRSATS